jgi:hypothetical protein
LLQYGKAFLHWFIYETTSQKYGPTPMQMKTLGLWSHFKINTCIINTQSHAIQYTSLRHNYYDVIETTILVWLVIYGFTSRSRIFHLYGDATIAGEGLYNLGLCSALRAFEQGGIFIVPHLL